MVRWRKVKTHLREFLDGITEWTCTQLEPCRSTCTRLAVNHHWTLLRQQNHLFGAHEKTMTAPADSTVTMTALSL